MRFLAAFLLLTQAVFARRGGGFAGGHVGGRGFGGRAPILRANRGFPGRFGNGFNHFGHRFNGFGPGRIRSLFPYYPYSPFLGGYGYGLGDDYLGWGGYPYQEPYAGESQAPPNVVYVNPPFAQMSPPPAPAAPLAPAVIHEYKFPPQSGETGATAFTIALKDGSQRSAAAAWIQGGKLHYLDPQGKEQALSPDLIDREKPTV